MKPVILVVDDEPLQRGILQTILDGEGYETLTAGSGSEALASIRKVPPDVVVSDLKMAGMDGIELLNAAAAGPAPPPMIIVTAHGTIDSAVEAVKQGAFDYLTKPLDKQKILMAVRKACERCGDPQGERPRSRRSCSTASAWKGSSPARHGCARPSSSSSGCADSPATVMVLGESGTGKELVARAIHYNSPRRTKPFIGDQLRGHPREPVRERAVRPRAGGLHRRHQPPGRPVRNQPTAARCSSTRSANCRCRCSPSCCACCRTGEVRRVGGKETIRVDVRIISATNRDLEREMEQGRVPRGPLLPAERGQHRASAAARAHRGHPGAGRALRAEVQRRVPPRHPRGRRRGDGRLAGASLAGERPPALFGDRACRSAWRRHRADRQPSSTASSMPARIRPAPPSIFPKRGSISSSSNAT